MVQNEKKVYLSCSIPQDPYMICSYFMVQVRKMIISLGVLFHFFKVFIFGVVSGVKKGKKWSKMTENSVCHAPYLRNHTSFMIVIYGTLV